MASEMSKADQAVLHVLRAIQQDGRKAYLMGMGSQTFTLLVEAYCERTGEDPETVKQEVWSNCRPEKVIAA